MTVILAMRNKPAKTHIARDLGVVSFALRNDSRIPPTSGNR